jgi:hypothetical protein
VAVSHLAVPKLARVDAREGGNLLHRPGAVSIDVDLDQPQRLWDRGGRIAIREPSPELRFVGATQSV